MPPASDDLMARLRAAVQEASDCLTSDDLMARLWSAVLVASERLTARTAHAAAHAAVGAMLLLTRLVLVPAPVQALVYMQGILYVGAHRSLAMFDEDSEPGEALQVEALSRRDGAIGPAILLAVTLSVYITYKCFGPQNVGRLLRVYFSCICAVALAETARPVLARLLPEEARRPTAREDDGSPWAVRFGRARLLAYAPAALASAAYLCTGDWTLHNVLVICLAVQVLTHVSLGRFAVGVGLLAGLFLCHAVWFFRPSATPSPAMDFSSAVEILLPVSWEPWRQATVGIGDVIAPGILVAMCLRFDAHTSGEAADPASDFSKPYFWSAWCACAVVKLVWGAIASGPALLCLAPAAVSVPLAVSYARGQTRDLLAYNEEELLPRTGSEGSKQS